jgi:hypothetical protein
MVNIKTRFDEKRQAQYLSALREYGEAPLAREEVGISWETVKKQRKKDPGFVELEQEAQRIYRARLAAEVHRRGMEGIEEPIYWNGKIVGYITKYSDKMLELHVKRHIPEYRDKVTVKNEMSGSLGLMTDLSELPDDIRRDLKSILERLVKNE